MTVIKTNPSKYSGQQPTEWKYLTKKIRYNFEFWESFGEMKIMVNFQIYTHFSIKGFHIKPKWRYLCNSFNADIQYYSNDFLS